MSLCVQGVVKEPLNNSSAKFVYSRVVIAQIRKEKNFFFRVHTIMSRGEDVRGAGRVSDLFQYS